MEYREHSGFDIQPVERPEERVPVYDEKASARSEQAEAADGAIVRLPDTPVNEHNAVAWKLLESGKVGLVAMNIEKFGLLSSDVAKVLMNAGYNLQVAENPGSFETISSNMAERLITDGYGNQLAENIGEAENLDDDVLRILIGHGFGRRVAEVISVFDEISTPVALELIDKGFGLQVVENLGNFDKRDSAFANKLINAGFVKQLARNLGIFQGLNNRVASNLISLGCGFEVVTNLSAFETLQGSQVYELVDAGYASQVVQGLDRFGKLGDKATIRLIEEGFAIQVMEHLDAFRVGRLNGYLAPGLIRAGHADLVVQRLGVFMDLPNDIAMILVNDGRVAQLAQNLSSFGRHAIAGDLAIKIIEAGYAEQVAQHLVSFIDMGEEAFVALIKAGHVSQAVKNLKYGSVTLSMDAASSLAKAGEIDGLAKNLRLFRNLDSGIAITVAKAGYVRELVEARGAFNDFDRAATSVVAGCLFEDGNPQEAFRIINESKESQLEFAPDSIAAIYLDQSVPKEVRLAGETYAAGLSVGHQRARLTHGMSPAEYQQALAKHPQLAESREPLKDGFEALLEQRQEQSGEGGEIYGSMKACARLFGPEVSMKFANRPGLSRHDAFMSINRISDFLGEQSAKSFPNEEAWLADHAVQDTLKRFSKVLLEVAKDDSTYEDIGTAHHKLNEVIERLGLKQIQQIIDEADKLGLPGLMERTARLKEPRFSPLESWKGLKDVADISDLLAKGEMIEELHSPELPAAVKAYAETLMAHPNISVGRLSKFLERPKAFLDSRGQYVDDSLQQALSPARMAEIERLGLSSADIRDALADGTMDRLQILPPMEETYRLGANGDEISAGDTVGESGLRSSFDRGIGRRREKIAGDAKDPKGLFRELEKWGQAHGMNREDCIAWMHGERDLPEGADTERLTGILYEKSMGVSRPEPEKSVEVRVRVGRKGDPDMVVAGNDTSSCMPFGDGKTNVYAWGPAFSQMVIERRNENGEWRTMAQSVLTLVFDAERPSTEVLTAMKNGESLNGLITSEAFAKPSKIMSDNLEPAPNDVAAGRSNLIQSAYAKFMQSYLERHAEALDIDPSEVIVGRETYLETDRWSLPHVDNTFVPLAPLSYTDNNGESSYLLKTGLMAKAERNKEPVETVTAADIMPMTLLESKNYADNPNLVFGLYDRQHKVVGASIAAERQGDPKLSLISRDERGVPVGYMIAYVDRTTDVPEVFIDDMAVDRSRNLLAARHVAKLLDSFFDRYLSHSRATDRPFMPIFAQMRESTSYKLMTRQIENLAQKHGLSYEVVEEGEVEQGGEPFKLVRIFLGRDAEGVAKSKQAFAERRSIVKKSGEGGYDDEPTPNDELYDHDDQ